jgi:hypothetical protein
VAGDGTVSTASNDSIGDRTGRLDSDDRPNWLNRQRAKRFDAVLDAAFEDYSVDLVPVEATRSAHLEAYLDRIANALERIADK